MKKIIFILATVLTCSLFSQSSGELKSLYKQLTDKEFNYETGSNRKVQQNSDAYNLAIDTSNVKANFFEKDSVEVQAYFEKYVSGEIINPYESKPKQYRVDLSNIKIKMDFNERIPDSYQVTNGDEIYIDTWGASENNYKLVINNEGYVIIPNIGKVDLNNLSYKEVKAVISKKLSYINGIKYSVRLGKINPIPVFVMGNVGSPGVYNISPFSNILEIISLAGGIGANGSLRNIKLIKGNNVNEIIDLYSVLFFGKQLKHEFKRNETIFVPLIGSQIAITGNVKTEGIFESKKGEKISDILKICGKTPFSDLNRIEIERLDENGHSKILSTSLDKDPILYDGDILRFFSTLVYNSSYVYLKGNFRQNKKIEYTDGMTLGSIFNSDEIIKPTTNLRYGNIIREGDRGQRNLIVNFSLDKVFDKLSDYNLKLMPRDTVEIFALNSITPSNYVVIKGEVKKAGVYALSNNMTIADLLYAAHGFTPFAKSDTLEIVSKTIDKKDKPGLKISYCSKSKISYYKLKRNDVIFVRNLPLESGYKTVKIFGEVKYPGEYMMKKTEKYSDLLKRCGGYTDEASFKGIQLFRESIKKMQNKKLQTLKQKLNSKMKILAAREGKPELMNLFSTTMTDSNQFKATGRVALSFDKNKIEDFYIQDNDSLFVPFISHTIVVMGEVLNETAITYSPKNNTVEYYLNYAGGETDLADKDNIHIIKASGKIIVDNSCFSNILDYTVEPGDMIYVPYDFTKVDVWGITKDISTILYQLGVSSAAIYNATK